MHASLLACLFTCVIAQNPSPADQAPPHIAIADASYGETLKTGGDVAIWWCDATRKIGRTRPVPSATGKGVRISAARGEFEAAQLVVRSKRAVSGLRCRASELVGPGGATIPPSAVSLLRVAYVPVTTPTDAMGVAGDWPDPLPPFEKPVDVPAEANQPIWVLIQVPRGAKPGDYTGTLELTAGDWSESVPLAVHVWSFTLPPVPRTRSAFGYSISGVARYQHLTTEAEKRAVHAKYMESFAAHRISPYDPVPFDPIRIRFLKDADPPRAEVDFAAFDTAMQKAVEEWRITSFILHIPGMGGGTFHERHEGEIAGFKAGSPQYEAMFSSAVRQIESHLKEKGWLDKAYIYWFDEPEPRDYAFVRAGMDRLKRSAPGLCRMLTEEPVEGLFGAVDLWCPVSPNFNLALADKRRAEGERFWWYVCTGPKAPYCTLFIDHPATDLRVWLWQTWQRRIEGILVWQSTYWTSSAAFPDGLQNPYADPMAYVSGYSTPPGTKKHWGNGDGRFLYPPEAAAGGSATPVLDGPVSSIRWEMLRDGVEDVDYLYLLEDLVKARGNSIPAETLARAKALLEVPAEITSDMTHYTFDSKPIEARRRAVAEMIEQLQ